MISFASDYVAGAHPEIIKRLTETNFENLSGYGTDIYSKRAIQKIRAACECPEADIYFLVGGTQTNQVVISTMLKPYEGVIAPKTGHINIHEAGAIEYAGHKVLEVDSIDGKLFSEDIERFINDFEADGCHEQHMVLPGMVYISYPTEYGTLYSLSELKAISEICRKNKLIFFIDGARLGYGLASLNNDLTLKDIGKLCDVFYIGGTKVGALCGEAIVFTKNNAPEHFATRVKQHGALLAKGRLLGIQFDTLFSNDLYMDISKHAIDMAEKLKNIFRKKGYKFFIDSPTNQQFIILENSKMTKLSKNVEFSFWKKYDEDNAVVRFATSWSTTEEDLIVLDGLI